MEPNVSRRQLLAAGAAGAASLAASSVQAADKKPAFDKVYDVIVVGSGFALSLIHI